MTSATITVEVADFKCGPKYARSFNGKFDASAKTWTIPVSRKGTVVSDAFDSTPMARLIAGDFGNGLRVISCDLAIGEWINNND